MHGYWLFLQRALQGLRLLYFTCFMVVEIPHIVFVDNQSDQQTPVHAIPNFCGKLMGGILPLPFGLHKHSRAQHGGYGRNQTSSSASDDDKLS